MYCLSSASCLDFISIFSFAMFETSFAFCDTSLPAEVNVSFMLSKNAIRSSIPHRTSRCILSCYIFMEKSGFRLFSTFQNTSWHILEAISMSVRSCPKHHILSFLRASIGLSFLILCMEYIMLANTTTKTPRTTMATLPHGIWKPTSIAPNRE